VAQAIAHTGATKNKNKKKKTTIARNIQVNQNPLLF
jgi:hypothetical protein